MARRKRSEGGKPADRRDRQHAQQNRLDRIGLRQIPETTEFELVFPPCVDKRRDDLAEVRAMLEAGEVDIAVDELRWLLQGCRALLEAHQLLGEIALADGDLQLARGHLGYAYDLGRQPLSAGGLPGTLPYGRPANRAFFEAGRGLVGCLDQLGEKQSAAEVVRQLLILDPSDPLELAAMLPKSGER